VRGLKGQGRTWCWVFWARSLGAWSAWARRNTSRSKQSQALPRVGQIRLARAYEEALEALTGSPQAQVLVTLERQCGRSAVSHSRATMNSCCPMGAVADRQLKTDTVATAGEIRFGGQTTGSQPKLP